MNIQHNILQDILHITKEHKKEVHGSEPIQQKNVK
jgi:hypothetical protein